MGYLAANWHFVIAAVVPLVACALVTAWLLRRGRRVTVSAPAAACAPVVQPGAPAAACAPVVQPVGRPSKTPLVWTLLKRDGRTSVRVGSGLCLEERPLPLVKVPASAEPHRIAGSWMSELTAHPMTREGRFMTYYCDLAPGEYEYSILRGDQSVGPLNPVNVEVHSLTVTGRRVERQGGDVERATGFCELVARSTCLPMGSYFYFYKLEVVPDLGQDPRLIELAMNSATLRFNMAQATIVEVPLSSCFERGPVDVTVSGRPIGLEALQQFDVEAVDLPADGELRLRVIMKGILLRSFAGQNGAPCLADLLNEEALAP